MPELTFNGERIEVRPGDTVLAAARRHGANVWFLCDGRGICQTCLCRVLEGRDQLAPAGDLEHASLGGSRIRRGYRLGCQAQICGGGAVSVESRVEELRRNARRLAAARELRSGMERLIAFNQATFAAAFDFARGVAGASPQLIPQLLRHPPTPRRVIAWTGDGWRLARRLVRDALA